MEINIDELRTKTAAAGTGQAADPEGKKAADQKANEHALKLRKLLKEHDQDILTALMGGGKNEYADTWVHTLTDGVQKYCDRMTVPGEGLAPESIALICLAAERTASALKSMLRSGKFGKGAAGFYEIAEMTMNSFVLSGIAMKENHLVADDPGAAGREKR